MALFLLSAALGHFPTIDDASGGAIFHDLESAANVIDVTRSQSSSRVALCEYPYFWFKFERPEKFSEANPDKMMVGATVPVIARFQSIRVAAALIGPGLPTAGTNSAESLPGSVQAQIPEGYGALAVPAIADVSDCEFLEDELSLAVKGSQYVVSSGGDDVHFAAHTDWAEPRCFFHEEWGGSDMWLVQDKVLELPPGEHIGETFYLVFWAPGDEALGPPTTTAKFGVVFGDVGQSENFDGDSEVAGDCSQPSNDFYENDCHGVSRPWTQTFNLDSCEVSTAVATPNFYACADSDTTTTPACTGLCHNHGSCPVATLDAATQCSGGEADWCAETCSYLTCGATDAEGGLDAAATTQYAFDPAVGPLGCAAAIECVPPPPGCTAEDLGGSILFPALFTGEGLPEGGGFLSNMVSLVFSAAFVKSVLCGLAQEVSVMLSPLEEGQRVCSPLTESQKEECVYYYDH
jgi:hypothetical protein